MRVPDWLVYTVVLAAVVTTLFVRGDDKPDAPAPNPFEPAAYSPRASTERLALPAPDPFDEEVVVQLGRPTNGVGTAFAINTSGVWLTARHVIDSCGDVGLSIGDGRVVRVEKVEPSRTSDLALLYTDRAPVALTLDLDRNLKIGDAGYHVGFPQGNSGEASSQLKAHAKLATRGRYVRDEPVLAWDERSRSDGIGEGTLAGMSGGPVFDEQGTVIGVTVAESPHQRRIYTASPESIASFLEAKGLVAPGGDARPLAAQTYSREADRLRRELAVVKVICRVDDR